jgi:hypothetical protein
MRRVPFASLLGKLKGSVDAGAHRGRAPLLGYLGAAP